MKTQTLFCLIMAEIVFLHAEDTTPEAKYCKYKQHAIVNPMTTCCKGMVIKPGIDMNEHWDSCAVETGQQSAETAQKAAWSIYTCILKKYNDDDSMSVVKFAELMTTNYPEEIKTQINEEAASLGATADLSNSKALNKVRVSYFDVEQEVCNGMTSATKNYGKDRECFPWEENLHRGGRCCKTSYFPIDIGYNSYMTKEYPQTEQPCPSVLQEIRRLLQIDHKERKDVEMLTNTMAEICDLTCDLISVEGNVQQPFMAVLNPNKYREENAFTAVAKLLLPKFLPATVQDDAAKYVFSHFNLNDTVQRINEFEFVDTVGGNSSTERIVIYATYVNNNTNITNDGKVVVTGPLEFSRRKFPEVVKHVPVYCSATKEILDLNFARCESADSASADEEQTEAPSNPDEE